MNAEQRENLMFEIRNRIAHLEMLANEIIRIMQMILEEKDLYERVLALIEKYEIDEFLACK
jgi:hypothetical protein